MSTFAWMTWTFGALCGFLPGVWLGRLTSRIKREDKDA